MSRLDRRSWKKAAIFLLRTHSQLLLAIYEQYLLSRFDKGRSPFLNRSASSFNNLSLTGFFPLNMAFVYAHMSRPKRGYYIVEFKEMNPIDKETNPYAYTDEFVRLLENNIREKPELWMQWGECRF